MVGALVVVGLAGSGGAHAQPDSVRAEILKRKGFSPDHSPTGALWRSAVVPGWGQYYNRQYYKIPFVYAGLAALGYRIYTSHQEYLLFKRAHLFGRSDELPDDYPQYESQFNDVRERLGTERLSVFRSQRDQFRRQRNIALLGMGLFYVLNVMDAYVSAHLLTFNVGETLGIRVRPVGPFRAARPRGTPVFERISTGALPEGGVVGGETGMQIQVRF